MYASFWEVWIAVGFALALLLFVTQREALNWPLVFAAAILAALIITNLSRLWGVPFGIRDPYHHLHLITDGIYSFDRNIYPLFHIVTRSLASITDLTYMTSLGAIPLVASTAGVGFLALVLRRLDLSNRVQQTATVAGIPMVFAGFVARPYTLAVPFILVFVWITTTDIRGRRIQAILLVLTVGVLWLHPIVLLVGGSVVVTAIAIGVLFDRYPTPRFQVPPAGWWRRVSFAVVIVVALGVHLVVLSGFAGPVIDHAVDEASAAIASDTPAETSTTVPDDTPTTIPADRGTDPSLGPPEQSANDTVPGDGPTSSKTGTSRQSDTRASSGSETPIKTPSESERTPSAAGDTNQAGGTTTEDSKSQRETEGTTRTESGAAAPDTEQPLLVQIRTKFGEFVRRAALGLALLCAAGLVAFREFNARSVHYTTAVIGASGVVVLGVFVAVDLLRIPIFSGRRILAFAPLLLFPVFARLLDRGRGARLVLAILVLTAGLATAYTSPVLTGGLQNGATTAQVEGYRWYHEHGTSPVVGSGSTFWIAEGLFGPEVVLEWGGGKWGKRLWKQREAMYPWQVIDRPNSSVAISDFTRAQATYQAREDGFVRPGEELSRFQSSNARYYDNGNLRFYRSDERSSPIPAD